jgi:hypothetical protein
MVPHPTSYCLVHCLVWGFWNLGLERYPFCSGIRSIDICRSSWCSQTPTVWFQVPYPPGRIQDGLRSQLIDKRIPDFGEQALEVEEPWTRYAPDFWQQELTDCQEEIACLHEIRPLWLLDIPNLILENHPSEVLLQKHLYHWEEIRKILRKLLIMKCWKDWTIHVVVMPC